MQAALPADYVCLRCGNRGTYREQQRDYPITVGGNTLLVNIAVEECRVCHEQLLDGATSAKLSEMAEQLQRGATGDAIAVGTTYRASAL